MSDLVSDDDHETTSSFADLHWPTSINVGIDRVQITIPNMAILNVAPNYFTSPHSMIAFTIPVLLGFLQIQAVRTGPSLFQVRPVTSMASVVSVLGYYYLPFLARRWLPALFNSQLIVSISWFLGSFSVASLASLLLPPSLWKFQFLFYVLFVLPEFIPLLRKIYHLCVRCSRRHRRRRVAQLNLSPHNSRDLVAA